MIEFLGQVSKETLKSLPKSLRKLYLSVVNDDHYKSLAPVLRDLCHLLPNLNIFGESPSRKVSSEIVFFLHLRYLDMKVNTFQLNTTSN